MMDLTPEANRRFEEYVTRMRALLRGSAIADDVEQSVREHVEVALAGVSGPIGAERLEPVLEQLGSPERWMSEDELPWWQRLMMRVTKGPEDWRLSYASFAITLLMFMTFPIGGVLLLVPAFILSRAFVELIQARGEAMGARRWLVYPPIVFALAMVTGVALIGPIAAAAAVGLGEHQIYHLLHLDRNLLSSFERVRIETGFLAAAAGVWWTILAGVYAIAYRPYRALFQPLTAVLRRRHAFVLLLVAAIFLGLGLTLMFAR